MNATGGQRSALVQSAYCVVAVALLLALCPSVAAQQAKKVSRIGWLGPGSPERYDKNVRVHAFFQGLRELGWIEGQNFIIEPRFAYDEYSRLPELAVELAG
ncbi:MAG TPA: hypothetical protein VL754_03795, partial [Verrucomicrobiae bacterium]|nr:hypothetical protein [Verrucomicrobiae bacterium]